MAPADYTGQTGAEVLYLRATLRKLDRARAAVDKATAQRDESVRRLAAAGLSLRTIAPMVGLTHTAVGFIVNGRNDRPPRATVPAD